MSFNGVLSLFCFIVAFFIALSALSGFAFWVFLTILIVGFIFVLFLYCSKCNSNECGHYFPRKILELLNIKTRTGKYTKIELGISVFFIALMIIYPQYYIIKTKTFYIFWVLIAFGYFEIRRFVCIKCDNIHCPVKKRPRKKD